MSFGDVIARRRKEKRLSQKALAELIHKEDGGPISPQYLSDIEHDRRSPSSDHLIQEFARVLDLHPDVLYFHAGQLTDDLRTTGVDSGKVVEAFEAFRKVMRDG